MNLDKIRKRMVTPTSKKDLLYMLKGKVRILTYEKSLQYSTLEELLGQYETVILLYPNTDQGDISDPIGHWICLFTIPGSKPQRVEYYDSYGAFIDDMVEDINEQYEGRGASTFDLGSNEGEVIPAHLKKLISDYLDQEKGEVFWNETPFQSEETGSACCGLWCVARIKQNHLNEDQFRRIYFDLPVSKNISPDLMISALILEMFPEMEVITTDVQSTNVNVEE